MKNFLLILTILLAVVLQTTALSVLAVWGVSPNLVLVLILILVIFKKFKKVWWLAVLAGLLLDLFSGLPFGLISLSLVIVAFLIDWFNRNVFSEIKLWLSIGLIGLASLAYNLLLIILDKLLVMVKLSQITSSLCVSSSCSGTSWLVIVIELGYNLVLGLIFFYGAKKILR